MSTLRRLIFITTLFGVVDQFSAAIAFDPATASTPSASTALPALPSKGGSATIAAGTSVTVRVSERVTSRTAKRGDYFKFELVNDLRSGAIVVIPAGTKGVGQVVHAAPKGLGGRAGELIVAARYLETPTGRVALKKTKFSVAGSDNVGAALTTSMVVPIVGMFITGTSVDLNVGSVLVAEIAVDFASDVAAQN